MSPFVPSLARLHGCMCTGVRLSACTATLPEAHTVAHGALDDTHAACMRGAPVSGRTPCEVPLTGLPNVVGIGRTTVLHCCTKYSSGEPRRILLAPPCDRPGRRARQGTGRATAPRRRASGSRAAPQRTPRLRARTRMRRAPPSAPTARPCTIPWCSTPVPPSSHRDTTSSMCRRRHMAVCAAAAQGRGP